MSPLHQANAAIMDGLRRQRRRQAERERAAAPLRLADSLLARLEELHLLGRKRVPDTFIAEVDALNAALPPRLRFEARSRITIVHLMDQLYELENALLGLRTTGAGGEDGLLSEAS